VRQQATIAAPTTDLKGFSTMITVKQAGDVNWACAALSLVILIVRLAVYRNRQNGFDVSSMLCVASILIISTRIAINYYLLRDGTTNDPQSASLSYSDAQDYAAIKTGSILAIVGRLLITTYYWFQVSLLLLFYSRIVYEARWITNMIRFCWLTIFASYVAVVLTTCLECRPFKLYWLLKPHPDRCVHAYVQLFTQGTANIVLDLILLVIAVPLLLNWRRRTVSQNVRVGALVMLGTICIIVTCIRLAYIRGANSAQVTRTFWASIQMLVSTFVANAPTIYGSVKLMQRRKSEQLARRKSRAEVWGMMAEIAPAKCHVTAEHVELGSKFVPQTRTVDEKV
jgi:hypothetical protein